MICEVIQKGQDYPLGAAVLEIEDYQCYLNFDANQSDLGKSGIRGVVIYTKPTLKVKKVEMNVEGFTNHLWVEVPTKGNYILCSCVYRTPSHDADPIERMTITDAARQGINKAYAYNNNLIITGDFNYKNINWEHQYAINGQNDLLVFICTI